MSFDFVDVVWSLLVDVAVYPIAEKKIGMARYRKSNSNVISDSGALYSAIKDLFLDFFFSHAFLFYHERVFL